jgi:hypothetical protein
MDNTWTAESKVPHRRADDDIKMKFLHQRVGFGNRPTVDF